MSHTYCNALFHCVFSTAERRKSIAPDLQPSLWAYMGGIAREHGWKALAAGGTEDHVHLLLSLSSSTSVAESMRIIKSVSSKWMHEQMSHRLFAWQEGYGAFSVGASQVDMTLAYIHRQQEHHRRRDFQSEFLAMLKKNGLEYDLRYVWS